MSAVSKGVDVLFSGTKESSDKMLDAVERLKLETGYEIKLKVFRA
jgi:hypothetical protein